MRWTAGLAIALLATAALAQPVQPVPIVSAPVGDLLTSSPYIDIANGQITARITRKDLCSNFKNRSSICEQALRIFLAITRSRDA